MRKNELKYLFCLIGIVTVISMIIYLPFVIKEIPFELVTIDTREELFPFYTEFTHLMNNFLENGSLPFYSWSNFLGSNFFVTKSFYLTTDITTYIAYFFKWYFWDAMMYTTIIKLIISSISMYLLLGAFKFKPLTKIIGALCYTFSSQLCYYTVYPMFLNIYSFLPLYFLGIEMIFAKNKKALFILMTAFLAMSHVYYFYLISFFTVFYYLYRYYMINGCWKNVIKETFKIIGYYCIGVLMASFIIIPFAAYLLGNDRVGFMDVGLIYDSVYPYLNIVTSLFSPYHVFQAIDHPLKTSSYNMNEVFLWAGTITSIMLPQVFFDKEKRFKKATRFLIIVTGLVLFVPILNSAVHGFSETSFRISVLVCIINIIIACHYIEDVKRINIKVLKYSIIAIVSYLLLIFPLVTIFFGNLNEYLNLYKNLILIVLFQIVAMISIYFIIVKNHKKKYYILVGAVIIDLFIPLYFETTFIPQDSERNSYQFMNCASRILQNEEEGLNSFLESLDDINKNQYYRLFVDRQSLYWNLSMNSSLFYNINALSTYDSMHATSLNKLKDIAPEINLASSKDFDRYLDIGNYELMTFLNTKYALVTDEGQLPDGDWTFILDDYLDFIKIYKNDNYRPLGTTYDHVITYSNYNNDYEKLFEAVICNDENLSDISKELGNKTTELIDISYGNNMLTGNCFSVDDTFMVITIPYDNGWNIYINGEKVEKYAVNGGFLGIPIPKGDSYVEMHFIPSGMKIGAIFSIAGAITFIAIIISENISRKRHKN